MITILALIAGLFIGFFIGLWACIVVEADFSAYNHKCWVQWNNVHGDEEDEVEEE